jgi:hypothetical protein
VKLQEVHSQKAKVDAEKEALERKIAECVPRRKALRHSLVTKLAELPHDSWWGN